MAFNLWGITQKTDSQFEKRFWKYCLKNQKLKNEKMHPVLPWAIPERTSVGLIPQGILKRADEKILQEIPGEIQDRSSELIPERALGVISEATFQKSQDELFFNWRNLVDECKTKDTTIS